MDNPLPEVRDPIHGFIFFDDVERALIDSVPVQRLKYIHQLALSYQIYPGATHTRFEHSLGTMELAGRAFDAVVRNSPQLAQDVFGNEDQRKRWRATLRLSGLLHDVGHAPFSHASDSLFTNEVGSHEEMTRRIIQSDAISNIIRSTGTYRLSPEEVAYVASGLGTAKTQAELVCKELITGDLGVDRMDYLRRDSQMCGVSYGLYDLPRLVETLRLARGEAGDPTLALEYGGVHAAEGLLTARYFMFSQVYFHDVRVIYDEHLVRFLSRSLPGGHYPDQLEEYLAWDDVRVLSLLRNARDDRDADAIIQRAHYRTAYQFTPGELASDLEFADRMESRLSEAFGEDVLVVDSRKTTRSLSVSQILVVEADPPRTHDIFAISKTLNAFQPIWFVRVYSPVALRTNVRTMITEVLSERPSIEEDV